MVETILVTCFGFVIGIGLNQLADRLPKHSQLDSVPACARLSVRHILVELATAGSWGALYLMRGPNLAFWLSAFYTCVYVLVIVTDLEHHLILNIVVLPALAVALLASLAPGQPTPLSSLIGAALGFTFFLLIALLRPGGMGAGDIKLAAFIGAATGFPEVLSALIIGIFAAGFAALVLIVTRTKTMKSYMPYGPFLALGGIVMLFLGR